MGLGLGLATTFFITQGAKDLFGKPRPDLLARCQLDPDQVGRYTLGGFGERLPEWNQLVSWTICRQKDEGTLNDGFQSFPSGHASSEYWTPISFFHSVALWNMLGVIAFPTQ